MPSRLSGVWRRGFSCLRRWPHPLCVFSRETHPRFGGRKSFKLTQARILADEFEELLWLGVGILFEEPVVEIKQVAITHASRGVILAKDCICEAGRRLRFAFGKGKFLQPSAVCRNVAHRRYRFVAHR